MDKKNIENIHSRVQGILAKKNHDYGNVFEELWARRGVTYGADKVYEKAYRIMTLSTEKALVENEPLEDAFLDIIGYASLCLDKLMQEREERKENREKRIASPVVEYQWDDGEVGRVL